MKHTVTVSVVCIFAVLFSSSLLTRAGSIQPPPGPIESSGVPLTEIADGIQSVQQSLDAGSLDPSIGFETAGAPSGTLSTAPMTVLVSGESGVIKQVIVGFDGFSNSSFGVELYVDGTGPANFAGHFRPTAGDASSGVVAFQPVYDVNIKFNSTVRARLANGNVADLSISVHYLPTN